MLTRLSVVLRARDGGDEQLRDGERWSSAQCASGSPRSRS
jgi:hypothetical protein